MCLQIYILDKINDILGYVSISYVLSHINPVQSFYLYFIIQQFIHSFSHRCMLALFSGTKSMCTACFCMHTKVHFSHSLETELLQGRQGDLASLDHIILGWPITLLSTPNGLSSIFFKMWSFWSSASKLTQEKCLLLVSPMPVILVDIMDNGAFMLALRSGEGGEFWGTSRILAWRGIL